MNTLPTTTVPTEGRLRSALIFSRAMGSALLDSTRTEELLIGEEISSVGRMSALIPVLEATSEGRAILAERPRLNTNTVDFSALAAMPPESLGGAYSRHLSRYGLDANALTTPVVRGQDDVSNYLLERVRQTHDIWHTMLGLGTQGHEEVLVHTFQWSQLRMPYSAFVVSFGGIKHGLFEGRWRMLRHDLFAARRVGLTASPLLSVYWERRWTEPLGRLRAELGVVSATQW